MARIYIERLEAGTDVDRLLAWLGEPVATTADGAEWVPPMDVFESAAALEVVLDLPGVPADALRVVVAQERLVVNGVKRHGACPHKEAAFHLVERSFGRFARVIRLAGAYDAGRASARLRAGELHIVLPRIDERRGREIRVAIQTG